MTPRRTDDVGLGNLVLIAILSVGCGYLTFNFGHILSVSREVIHESLAQQHHLEHEYCSYTKCTLNKHHGRKDAFGLIIGKRRHDMDEKEHLQKLMFPDAANDTVVALTSRSCGSMAEREDGTLDVKCLEGSPTAVWFENYYRLGHRHNDLFAFITKGGDFEGVPLQSGVAQKADSVEDCAAACLMQPSHVISGPMSQLPCNAFSFCAEETCIESGQSTRSKGDCFLQFIEAPGAPLRKYRGQVSSSSTSHLLGTHDHAQWWGGVLLPWGMTPANATVM